MSGRESRLDKYFEEAYVHQSENLIMWTSKGTFLHIQKVQVYSMYRYTACTGIQHVQVYSMYRYTACTGIQHVQVYSMYRYTACTGIQYVQY